LYAGLLTPVNIVDSQRARTSFFNFNEDRLMIKAQKNIKLRKGARLLATSLQMAVSHSSSA